MVTIPGLDTMRSLAKRVLTLGNRRGMKLGDALYAAANLTGIAVTPESALTLSAYFAAINVISTDVASLPIRVYQRRADGGRDEVTSHPARELLSVSPDGQTTAMRQRQAWVGHTLGRGNGFMEIERDGDGNPIGLHLLDPGTTQVKRTENTNRVYYELENGKRLRGENVLHLAGLGFNGLEGYAPVRLFRQCLSLGLAAEGFGAAFFGNGSTPKGVLKTAKVLGREGRRNLRESFEEVHRGVANAHGLVVLENGVEWVKTSVDPEDAQFLATRMFQVVEIARIFRMPPHKIGDFSQAHLANLEASNLDYMTTTLMPWCEAIEQVCNLRLLSKDERAAGLYVEHNMNALLRGDMRARAEFYSRLRDLGAISPNEVRRFENMNPIEDGDLYLVPLNLVPLALAARPPADVTRSTSNQTERAAA